MILAVSLPALLTAGCGGGTTGIESAGIRKDLSALAADDMEGRAPGTPGGDKAAEYIARRFEEVGLAPGFGEGYAQPVPMVGVELQGEPSLAWFAGSRETVLRMPGDMIVWPGVPQDRISFDRAPMAFVGYGITAPEYGWSDYEGVDVSGKIVVSLVNDPPSADPAFFGGPALTYYGRWTYKIEEATRRGAAGIVLIHNTEMAGYPWNVVEGSWTGEQFSLPRTEPKSTLVEAWIGQDAADRLLEASGLSLEEGLKRAATPGFRSVDLKTTFSCDFGVASRRIDSANVGGYLEGSDPNLRDEMIVLTSHYDHLGIGPAVEGDTIYNGALDNASGTALLIEEARVLLAERAKLGRSVLFLAVTGEEQGLLGSEYFVAHQSDAFGRTVADVNFDAVNVWDETSDMVAMGADQSSIGSVTDEVFGGLNIVLADDPAPEKGHFFRSDHFSFVKAGIPAVYYDYGLHFRNQSADWGQKMKDEYLERSYHQPSDEYDPGWQLNGTVQMGEVIRQTVLRLASSGFTVAWNPDSPFARSGSTSGSR
jgi:Zn-dependent M28 family amino/carboxypeptidase